MPEQKEFIGASDHLHNRIGLNMQDILNDHSLLENIITEELNDLEEALEDKIKTEEEQVKLKKYDEIVEMLKNHTEWKMLEDEKLLGFLYSFVYEAVELQQLKELPNG